jgi:hypothetical protein
MKKIVFAATAALLAIGATAAMAQTTPAPAVTAPAAAPKVVAPLAKPPAAPAAAATTAPATTATPAKKTVGVATTEIGKKCSADADAAGLKGKPRIAFRAKCKKEAAKTAAVKKN